ncbi:MAG: hypothetical protein J4G17_00570 [Anaerolineae bacterium]|nr:hypothetical protein [Anaerolineae bacterium]
MPPLRDALTRLAGLEVPGIAHNFAIDQLPAVLDRSQAPALLVLLPGLREREASLFREQGEAFSALTFSESPRQATVLVTHLLLVSPRGSAAGLRGNLPALVDGIDACLRALTADVTLGDALATPTQVRVEPGAFRYGGVDWQGCAFRHRWLLELQP